MTILLNGFVNLKGQFDTSPSDRESLSEASIYKTKINSFSVITVV
jgi:hypothetical protein